MQDLFNRRLESFLDGVCEGHLTLERAKGKVYATLKNYEDYCGHRLRVADVYLDRADQYGEVLTRRCINFIDQQPKPPDREMKRHQRRMKEDKSILRRLMRVFRSPAGAGITPEQISLADMDNMPPQWEVLKKILPRSDPASGRKRIAAGDGKREDFPYSLAAQHAVLALRQVNRAHGSMDLDVLFGELNSELVRAMKRNVPHPFHRSLTVQFSRIRKDYFSSRGLPVPGKKISIPLSEFPEPLKSEVERYRQQALAGFGADKELRRGAEKFGFMKDPYSDITIKGAVVRLQLGMGYIFGGKDSLPERLSVEDLIRTEAVPVEDKNGRARELRFVNEYVELYYQKQLKKETPSKKADYDSAAFEQFRVAVAGVAFVNGYDDYILDFRKGYSARLDRETPEGKKSKKKSVFSRAKIDREIRRLHAEVVRIVKSGSFKTSRVGKDDDVHARMTKVLLFVNVAVLRHLGYRQQCLRRCKLGEHIIFHPDKSITLEFPKKITKNKKHIRIKLSMRRHRRTHKLLLDTLWLYHDHVYPYVLERDGGVKGHFFVNVSADTGLFRRYEDEDVFSTSFREWGKKHFRYEDFEGAQEENLTLHPHFFRGCCVDWLLEDLGMSRDEVATFIGDEPETLEAYINANKIHDATLCLSKANRDMKAEAAEHDRPRRAAAAKVELKKYKKAMRAKDNQLQDAWDELRKMRELMVREKDEKDAYLMENRDLQRRVSSLEVENARLLSRPAAAL